MDNVVIWYMSTLWNDYHKQVTTSTTSHSYHFFMCVVRMLKIFSLYKFQVHSTVLLTIVTMLYIRPPELICLIREGAYPSTTVIYCSKNYPSQLSLKSYIHIRKRTNINRNLKEPKTGTKLNGCGRMQIFSCHYVDGFPHAPLPLALSDCQTSWWHTLRNPGEIAYVFTFCFPESQVPILFLLLVGLCLELRLCLVLFCF